MKTVPFKGDPAKEELRQQVLGYQKTIKEAQFRQAALVAAYVESHPVPSISRLCRDLIGGQGSQTLRRRVFHSLKDRNPGYLFDKES